MIPIFPHFLNLISEKGVRTPQFPRFQGRCATDWATTTSYDKSWNLGSYSNFCLHSDDPKFPSFQQLTGYPVLGKSYTTAVLPTYFILNLQSYLMRCWKKRKFTGGWKDCQWQSLNPSVDKSNPLLTNTSLLSSTSSLFVKKRNEKIDREVLFLRWESVNGKTFSSHLL